MTNCKIIHNSLIVFGISLVLIGVCNAQPKIPEDKISKNITTKELYDAALEAGLGRDFSTAKQYLEKAKNQEPSNIPVAIALSLTEETTTERLPLEAGVCIFRSIQAGNAKDWDQSLADAKKASEMASNSAPVFVHLGTVYVGLIQANRGDHYAQLAIAAYRKALDIDPTSGVAYFNLGVALAATGQWVEARDNLLKAKAYNIIVPDGLLRQIEVRIGK